MFKNIFPILILAYIYTWVLGVPAAHNTVSEIIHNTGLARKESGEHYSPNFNFGPAFPLLPFVVVSKHSYYIGNIGAADGWWVCFGLFNKYQCEAIYANVS